MRLEYDVVIVGSGVTGLAAALGAVDENLSTIIIESSDVWGGNSNKSGGGLWLPNNPLMRRDRVADSREEALTYLAHTAKNDYRATSPQRQEAFVDGVDDWVNTCAKHGIHFVRAKEYPDYYPELPGGKIGPALEVYPVPKATMGPWASDMAAQAALPVMTDDVWLLARAFTTPGGLTRGAQLMGRIGKSLLKGEGLPAGLGVALTAALLAVTAGEAKVPLLLNTPMTDLVIEGGRGSGVVIERHGNRQVLKARKGVVLGSGGFDGNRGKRKKLQGIEGNPSGVLTNQGGPIDIAEQYGAALELMDDAWWGVFVPATRPGEDPTFVLGERSLPYSIIVDDQGRRFANESESYVDLGHHMLAHNKAGRWWLITDRRHR